MSWPKKNQYYNGLLATVEQQLQQALEGMTEREAFMDAMRCFRQAEEEKRYAAYLQKQTTLEDMMFDLTALAHACLQEAYLFESQVMRELYGAPQSHFHMIAMGKFGGCEMTLKSDLDLIFLFAEHAKTVGPERITNQEYFARLVQRLISNLSALTQHGRAYEVDTELRPSGHAGILVSSWASFTEYHQKDARIWEKQALLKARPIEPDPAVALTVLDRLQESLWNRSYGPEIATDMHELRQKMERELAKENQHHYNIKVGPGGIVDIEFMVQYLQLRHGEDDASIRTPHTLSAIRALVDRKYLQPDLAAGLEKAYLFYRQVETALRHLEERAVAQFPRQDGELLDGLATALAMPAGELLGQYETLRQRVRQIYETGMGL